LWLAHKREKRKPVTPTQAQELLSQLAAVGPTAAAAALKTAIAKDWAGPVLGAAPDVIVQPESRREQAARHQQSRADGVAAREELTTTEQGRRALEELTRRIGRKPDPE
jgi:hypothetical protein